MSTYCDIKLQKMEKWPENFPLITLKGAGMDIKKYESESPRGY
jgi:hypothetical protein